MKHSLKIILFSFTFIRILVFSEDDIDDQNITATQCHYYKNVQPQNDNQAPLSNLEGEPSAFVHNCVNVISGQFCISQVDLIVHHATNPLTLERSFAGSKVKDSSLGAGWHINHSSYVAFDKPIKKVKEKIAATAVEDHGGYLTFENNNLAKKFTNICIPLNKECLKQAVTNNGQGFLSGQTNLRNQQIEVGLTGSCKIKSGSGKYKVYRNLPKVEENYYWLDSEVHPTGNKYICHYERNKNQTSLKSVSLADAKSQIKGQLDYGKLKSGEEKKTYDQIVSTNDDRNVKYTFIKRENGINSLRRVSRTDGPTEEYYYKMINKPGLYMELIKAKTMPLHRNLKIEYYDPTHNIVRGQDIKLEDEQDPRIYRVKKLLAPAGTTKDLVTLYEFVYDLNIDYSPSQLSSREFKNGTCNVYDALNHRIQYIFDQNHRLEGIDKFDENGTLYTQERLSWGDNESSNNTCLLSRAFFCRGNEVFSKKYLYDAAGNILQDILHGDLGNSKINEYIKTYVYSSDDLNLLLEETDGITTTKYVYYPGSNKLKAKYTGSPDKIMRRWFYDYNDDAALTVEIEDDGQSIDRDNLTAVTERFITKNTPSNKAPIGYPLEISKYCLDLSNGKEILIKRVVNKYNSQAKITKQDHYDDLGTYRFSLFWEYDNLGNIVKEIDAIGRFFTKKYDLLGNCIYEQGPATDCHKEFSYDFMDRLILSKEIHNDGVIFTTENRYDLMGRKTATIVNGNETNFELDAFGREKVAILPFVIDETNNAVRPTIYKTYDAMSKPSSETDARGNTKYYTHNVRGQLIKTVFPDKSIEKTEYLPNGRISYSIARNGVKTTYHHDALGRPISVIISDQGKILSETSKIYSGFHVIEEIDAMGIPTKYEYYPNGKIKNKRKEREFSEYFYDSLGRLVKTIESTGECSTDVTVMLVEYDLLNRVIKESIEDGIGKKISLIDYTYDMRGNIETTSRYNQAGMNTTHVEFDSHGIPIKTTNANGDKTYVKYDYNYRNHLGQFVTYKEVTDALGNVIITIEDALGRTISTERRDSKIKTIQLQHKNYDLSNNLCKITDKIFYANDHEKDVISTMSYDVMNKLVSCKEAVGTPEEKQIHITYNEAGQKEKLIKNDLTEIHHTYDKLGRLKTLRSSDGSIFYEYHYNLNNSPIKVVDHIQNTETLKSFDKNNRLTNETLSNGLNLHYENDFTGRPLKITLPDSTSIGYEYQGCLLKRVIRYNSSGKEVYSHVYEEYDLSRHVLKSTLAVNGGILSFTYDNLGREKAIRSDHYEERELFYDPVGNLLNRQVTDTSGMHSYKYQYDSLCQLIKEEGEIIHDYSYDSMYNRKTKDGNFQEINELNQLLDNGVDKYEYDLNGNMIQKSSNGKLDFFAYDALDRLTSVVKDNQKIFYTYDENNRRTSKSIINNDDEGNLISLKKERFLYTNQNEIGAVNDEGIIYQLRLLGLGKGAEIGSAVAIEISNKLYIPIHDHNGNVSTLIDGISGEAIENYNYSSFGEPLFKEAITPWTYASKRYDFETGFLYFGRRFYEPSNGRWISLDPIGREGGPNLYAYVLNSPLTHFDEYGLFGMHSQCGGISSFLGSLFESTMNLVETVARFPGAAINFFGYHLVPIPYVKDAVEFGGWCLQGKNPNDFVPSWNREHSKLMKHEGYGYGDPRVMHAEYCGIMTSPQEFRQRLANLSQAYGGITVWGVYNDSQGFLLDLVEVGSQKLGIPTRAQKVAENATRAIMNQMGDYKDEGTLFAYAHSQGAETVHNLSGDLRKRMNVIGIAPARVLQSDSFKSAENYVSRMDIVPWADPLGMIKGMINGNIHYLPSTGCPIKDHYYNSDEFANFRRNIGDEFKRSFGEVL